MRYKASVQPIIRSEENTIYPYDLKLTEQQKQEIVFETKTKVCKILKDKRFNQENIITKRLCFSLKNISDVFIFDNNEKFQRHMKFIFNKNIVFQDGIILKTVIHRTQEKSFEYLAIKWTLFSVNNKWIDMIYIEYFNKVSNLYNNENYLVHLCQPIKGTLLNHVNRYIAKIKNPFLYLRKNEPIYEFLVFREKSSTEKTISGYLKMSPSSNIKMMKRTFENIFLFIRKESFGIYFYYNENKLQDILLINSKNCQICLKFFSSILTNLSKKRCDFCNYFFCNSCITRQKMNGFLIIKKIVNICHYCNISSRTNRRIAGFRLNQYEI